MTASSSNATGALTPLFFAVAPHDSSTILLPVTASQLGHDGAFSYSVQTFSLEGAGADAMPGTAAYDPFAPALTDYPFVTVDPSDTEVVPLSFDPSSFGKQQPRGLMVVAIDDAAGAEAHLHEMSGTRRSR